MEKEGKKSWWKETLGRDFNPLWLRIASVIVAFLGVIGGGTLAVININNNFSENINNLNTTVSQMANVISNTINADETDFSALHRQIWGPSRPTFTMANPAPYIVFNSIIDNPSLFGTTFGSMTTKGIS